MEKSLFDGLYMRKLIKALKTFGAYFLQQDI